MPPETGRSLLRRSAWRVSEHGVERWPGDPRQPRYLALGQARVERLWDENSERRALLLRLLAGSVAGLPFGDVSVHFGWRIDGSKVQFWAHKKDAEAGAKAIGWRVLDVTKVHTRFCNGWALSDGRFGLVSKDSYAAAVERRNG